jgi:hypothetical protein
MNTTRYTYMHYHTSIPCRSPADSPKHVRLRSMSEVHAHPPCEVPNIPAIPGYDRRHTPVTNIQPPRPRSFKAVLLPCTVTHTVNNSDSYHRDMRRRTTAPICESPGCNHPGRNAFALMTRRSQAYGTLIDSRHFWDSPESEMARICQLEIYDDASSRWGATLM